MPSRHVIRSSRAASLWLLLLLTACLACAPREKRTASNGLLPGNASALDYLDLLGLDKRIMALPRTVDGYSMFLQRHPEATSLPRLADFKAETILSLQPGLVLSDATQSPETRAYLKRVGIPVLILRPYRSFVDGRHNLELIAKSLELDALPTILALVKKEQELRSLVSDPDRGPRVLPWVYYGEAHWTAGIGTGADYALALAGARNVARQLGLSGHKEIPIEVLLKSDPDALLVSDPTMAKRLREHPRLKDLRCLKKANLIQLDPALASCNSPYLIDAAAEIRRQLLALELLR